MNENTQPSAPAPVAHDSEYRDARYLGDAVYVHRNAVGDVVLTTDNHIPAQAGNVIILDSSVLNSFYDWMAGLKASTVTQDVSFASENVKNACLREIEDEAKQGEYSQWLTKHLATINLSDSATLSLSGRYPMFYVSTREDLQALLTLAPTWRKDKVGLYISYAAQVDGFSVSIYAKEGALPGTCRTVTRIVTIPAQAERTEEVTELVCEFPSSATGHAAT